MAGKYLMAMEYMDVHAQNILLKHARKRPLGDLESRHRYTPPQPVLSCRTVDIDISGTRTYRPRSSADIIEEQHKLIHKIYTKNRNVSSAPPKRSVRTPRKSNEENQHKYQKVNIEVKGRPLSQSTLNTARTPKLSAKRPKTTGGIKNTTKESSENFMLVRNNTDLVDLNRTINKHIRKHYDAENLDLNQGKFVRGQKRLDISSGLDAWLTFSGTDESQGVVDAFARVDESDEFYNIESGVGSRIAQQLQKGDKIRVGINGKLQSRDLRVKKWTKEEKEDVTPEDKESDSKEMSSSKESLKKVERIVPLCWDDQVESEGIKVLSARGPPEEKKTINMNETHPVIFTKLIEDDEPYRPKPKYNTYYTRQEGFRVKQRQKGRPSVDGKQHDSKITVLTIDPRSEEEEKKLDDLTVDEVLKTSLPEKDGEKINGQENLHEIDGADRTSMSGFSGPEPLNLRENSKISTAESHSSGNSDPAKYPKPRSTPPTYSSKTQQMDFSISPTFSQSPGTRPRSRSPGPAGTKAGTQSRVGSAKSSRSAKDKGPVKTCYQKGPNPVPMVTFAPNSARSEPEYIQISHPVKNPNAMIGSRKNADYVSSYSTNAVRQVGGHSHAHSGVREPLPSPELEETPRDLDAESPAKPVTPLLAINIPTAEYSDSALNSPSHKAFQDENGLSPRDRKEQSMRDSQIDQITSLLGDAIIANKTGEINRVSSS